MLIFPNQMALLKAHPYFDHISEKDMTWFLTCMDARLEETEAGETLVTKDEECEFVPVVLSGKTDKAIARFSSWEHIESQSGLSHSIIALVAPDTVKTEDKCFIVWLRVMRLLKPCNYHCPFHVKTAEKI